MAAAVYSPLALAVHGLAATTLGALLQVVLVWASITIVHGNLAHTVHAAALILVVIVVIRASIVVAPRANAVNRLRTTIVGALLEGIGVWASVAIVSRWYRHLVQPALLVLVSVLIMRARVILIPRANAVHGLGASTHCALQVAISELAIIPIVRRRL